MPTPPLAARRVGASDGMLPKSSLPHQFQRPRRRFCSALLSGKRSQVDLGYSAFPSISRDPKDGYLAGVYSVSVRRISQSIQSPDQCARGCLPAPQTGLVCLFFILTPARVQRLDARLKGRVRGALLQRRRPDGLLTLCSIGHRVSSPRWLSIHPIQETQGWTGTCAGSQDRVHWYRIRLSAEFVELKAHAMFASSIREASPRGSGSVRV